MATEAARAARNHEARQRLDAALAAVGQRLGITVPPAPKRSKDPGLQPVVELERFAAFAEAVLAALPAGKEGTGAGQGAGAATGGGAAADDAAPEPGATERAKAGVTPATKRSR